jgi:RNase H-fold protein (predicted Holliday junction resolvase)
MQTTSTVLAIDPGRVKCGLAVLNRDGEILERAITKRDEIVEKSLEWIGRWNPQSIIIGHSTGSFELRRELELANTSLIIHVLNERNSTLEARALYWQVHPPHGWRRLLPLSLQTPPVPLDDFAAAILARRFLTNQ